MEGDNKRGESGEEGELRKGVWGHTERSGLELQRKMDRQHAGHSTGKARKKESNKRQRHSRTEKLKIKTS